MGPLMIFLARRVIADDLGMLPELPISGGLPELLLRPYKGQFQTLYEASARELRTIKPKPAEKYGLQPNLTALAIRLDVNPMRRSLLLQHV